MIITKRAALSRTVSDEIEVLLDRLGRGLDAGAGRSIGRVIMSPLVVVDAALAPAQAANTAAYRRLLLQANAAAFGAESGAGALIQ